VKKLANWKGAAIQREFEQGSRGLAIVRSRFQAITSKDTAGWKKIRVIFLKGGNNDSFTVTTWKWSINPVINPNSFYSHFIHVIICTVQLKFSHNKTQENPVVTHAGIQKYINICTSTILSTYAIYTTSKWMSHLVDDE
jgi:hypothetical protein